MTEVVRAQEKFSNARFSEGNRLFGSVSLVMNILYEEHVVRPRPEYVDVHLLSESLAMMFSPNLIAQHGFVYHLAARRAVYGSENPALIQKLGMEVSIQFQKDKITPKLGSLKVFPHSWLLHERSGTIIDFLPLGGEIGVDYPRRHAPHQACPPFNVDPTFELLKGKLPKAKQVKQLRDTLEAWVRESSGGDLSTVVG